MAPTYQSVVFNKRPEKEIIPGETFSIIITPKPAKEELKKGEFLIRIKYITGLVYGACCHWGDDARLSVGIIEASNSSKFSVGSYATGLVGWTELKIVNEDEMQTFEIPENRKLADALSVLGFTSPTAYYSMQKIAKVQPGGLVVISGAAGATRSIAGQIAKIQGARVLGLTGSNDKVQWLKDIGFDDALNYRDGHFVEKFKTATTASEDCLQNKDGGIDIFWDNVGGKILEYALDQVKFHGRVVFCGGVSQVNVQDPQGPRNYLNIGYKRLQVQGFLVFDYPDENPQAYEELSQWYLEGRLQARETSVPGGLAQAEKALYEIYKGINIGKLLVEL